MIERGGKTELGVQVLQAREGAGERGRRMDRAFVHQFDKEAIGHATAAANVVGFGLQAAADVIIVIVGGDEFHNKVLEKVSG